MYDSIPISLTQITEENYVGNVPSRYIVVGDIPGVANYFAALPGYGTPNAVLAMNSDGTGMEWIVF